MAWLRRTGVRWVVGMVAAVGVGLITYPMWAPMPHRPRGEVRGLRGSIDPRAAHVPLDLVDDEGRPTVVVTDAGGRFEIPSHYFRDPDTIPELKFDRFIRSTGSPTRVRYRLK